MPAPAAKCVGQALQVFDGRWKLVILFDLFGGRVLDQAVHPATPRTAGRSRLLRSKGATQNWIAAPCFPPGAALL